MVRIAASVKSASLAEMIRIDQPLNSAVTATFGRYVAFVRRYPCNFVAWEPSDSYSTAAAIVSCVTNSLCGQVKLTTHRDPSSMAVKVSLVAVQYY